MVGLIGAGIGFERFQKRNWSGNCKKKNCQKKGLGETGVSRDTFYFFSNIAENIYDRDFDLTRQGRGILPLQTGLISYVVTSFVATEYGVKDTWSKLSKPTPSRGRLGQYTGYVGTVLNVGGLQAHSQ